jgi:hypothetical protein
MFDFIKKMFGLSKKENPAPAAPYKVEAPEPEVVPREQAIATPEETKPAAITAKKKPRSRKPRSQKNVQPAQAKPKVDTPPAPQRKPRGRRPKSNKPAA